jgi:hypothetical protein
MTFNRRSLFKQMSAVLATLGFSETSLGVIATLADLPEPQPSPETVRILPRNLALAIALDPSLTRIERVDATSAFAAIPRTALVLEDPADFLFKKTLIQEDEAIKKAVNRLKPQFHTLLATKLLRLTENHITSGLSVRVSLEKVAPRKQVVMQQATLGAAQSKKPLPITESLTIDSEIQYCLWNNSDRPLYFIALGLDSSGEAIALNLTDAESAIAPHEARTIPDTHWRVQAPAGTAETYLIFSPSPLSQTYTALATAVASPANQRITRVNNLLGVVEALLQELHETSATLPLSTEISTEDYALNVNAWATFGFIYSVV